MGRFCQKIQCGCTRGLVQEALASNPVGFNTVPSVPHLRWLSAVVCPTPAQQIVFQEYVSAVNEPTERLQRLEQELNAHVTPWRFHRGILQWAPTPAGHAYQNRP